MRNEKPSKEELQELLSQAKIANIISSPESLADTQSDYLISLYERELNKLENDKE